MEDKDIKILEEFISNYKDIQEKYKDDEIQAEIERSCYFEEVPAIQIENLLQAYKQDEKVIKEMADAIYGEFYNPDLNTVEKIIDYFRKKCE